MAAGVLSPFVEDFRDECWAGRAIKPEAKFSFVLRYGGRNYTLPKSAVADSASSQEFSSKLLSTLGDGRELLEKIGQDQTYAPNSALETLFGLLKSGPANIYKP